MRDVKFHVFHKTIVDWLTGEIAEGSSIREPTDEFNAQCKDGHAMLAEGFIAWRRYATPPEGRAPDDEANGCDTAFCTGRESRPFERFDNGFLSSVAKDYHELPGVDGVDLTVAVELRRFVGKYMDVLQRDNGAEVMQLALH